MKTKNNSSTILFLSTLLCYSLLYFSCRFEKPVVSMNETINSEPKWNFIIYMAADNDLFKSTENDLNEILKSKFSEQDMRIFVFLDTSKPITIQEKEYSGSNFFSIKSTRNKKNYLTCIPIENLGFEKENTENVDSGDIHTLEKILAYTNDNYPANEQALILWGHGVGYKYCPTDLKEATQTKGICQDYNTSSYISTIELANALKTANISVIGFDACFSGLLEVAFQLRNSVKLFIGSEGALNVAGWNYETIFTQFSASNQSYQSLTKVLEQQYYEQYNTEDLLILDTSKTESIKYAFNKFSKAVANYINSSTNQKQVFDLIINKVKSFVAPTFPTEMFVDIYDFAKQFNKANLSDEITRASKELMNALTVKSSLTNSLQNNKISIAIYFMALESKTVSFPLFDSVYINDGKSTNKLDFTLDCNAWTSTRNYQIIYDSKSNDSLLDKLFFTIF